ncbi:MAG: lysozyme inhibitor LprI family protein [Giesbergeria sp.]|uniref:lysozyme inhibitor LprI family protein n=1 Tax=Giesbergeria sp. TaxID=2818473 RepID=UPI00260EF54E|nr:lysozyme inhibitor LprI family protein [Giesbergeria sp.]MDD2609273.1 lysozyme inhibitor LprI family protein [Giesbergeria sp.]
MKPLLLQITLIFAAALPLAASAQESNLSQKFDACMHKADSDRTEIDKCVSAELKRQDVRLNEAYKTIIKMDNNPENKKELQAVQRTWIRFRDLNCELYPITYAGNLDLSIVGSTECKMNVTADRVKALEYLVNHAN